MPKVSVYKDISTPSNPEYMELDYYLEKIRDGYWEDIVTKCRLIKDKEERERFKDTMPTTSMSGIFSYRSDGGLKEHNEFIAIDLDHVENINEVKKLIFEDKYVYAVFSSVSGYGLRVLFKIDPKKHKEAFLGICTYIYENYNQPADTNGSNVSKPYIVSYDPYLMMKVEEPPVFKKYVKETPIKPIPNFVHTAGDFESILNQITSRQINICESYEEWLKVGFAICEQFGEDGRYYFHKVSQVSSKYNPKTVDDQYKQCLKARGTTKANISTFYYLAKINGVNISSEQTKIIVRTTINGRKTGLKVSQIIANLKKNNNIEGADKVVEKIFESNEDLFESDDNNILEQLEMFTTANYELQMNEVTGFLEQDGVRLSQSDLNSIFISAKKKIPKLDYPLMMRLYKSDFIKSYNPFFRFFESDGLPVVLPAIPVSNESFKSPLIDKLAKCIKNSNPSFTIFFLRKWLVSVVSAAHKVHSPILLCLIGPPGCGKTEFFRRLMPKDLNEYYTESKLDKEKDDEILMTECLIIMDDEMSGKSKTDAQKLKNLTSKQYFSLRRPYGDHNEKILRLATLCGTSNYKTVLNDTAENRRIVPIEVEDIDKVSYNSIDKRDLWMECFRLYKEGFDWRITLNDTSFLNQDKDEYEVTSKERELIDKYFMLPDGKSPDCKLSSTEILVEIEILTRQKLSVNAIGRELEYLKFERKTCRDQNGKTSKKWSVVRINRPTTPGSNDQIYNKPPDNDLPF